MKEFVHTDCFCLKFRAIGKSSAILYFFSKDLGPLSVYEKGFFEKSSKVKPLFDLGQELKIVLEKKGESYFLKEAAFCKAYDLSQYEPLTFASFILDLLSQIPATSEMDAVHFYENLHLYLYHLSEREHLHSAAIQFQLKILEFLGIMGNPCHCSRCKNPIPEKECSFASTGSWNFFCVRCKPFPFSIQISAIEKIYLEHWQKQKHLGNFDPGLSGKSRIQIQKHFNTIFEDWFSVKSAPEMLRLMEKLLL